jgi:hypothetical protein
LAALRFPWDETPVEEAPPPLPPLATPPPKRRGRRPGRRPAADTATGPTWLYHHLTISGPAEQVAAFASAARGAGVSPWRLDAARIAEDVFTLAGAVPPERRHLSVAGCRLLARQFRDRVAAHHAQALARVGHSKACPFDLQALLPVPDSILMLGPQEPAAQAWLAAHWGTTDRLRHVTQLPAPRPGRRLPRGHAVVGYGFFTAGDTTHTAIAALQPRWPTLRFVLQPRPSH